MRLEGKCALITGASRGIGRATALRLAEEGCAIAVNYVAQSDRDNAQEAAEVAALVEAMGQTAIVIEADVTDRPQVYGMVGKAIQHLGKLDILVNNAGITRGKTLRKMDPEEWDQVLAVNLTGVFNCTRAVLEHMMEREYGRIISLSSVVGLEGNFGQTHYGASKAGLLGFSKSLAREVAAKGLTVNCIAPGFIDTEMIETIPQDVLVRILDRIPMGAMGRPVDVANAALFLASDEASYITGQTLSVNGGVYM